MMKLIQRCEGDILRSIHDLGRKRIQLIVLSLISLFLFSLIPFYPVVAFEVENSGKTIAYLPHKEGMEFHIKYIHSIHLTPVIESYTVREDELVQNQLIFEAYGIGMPSNAEGNEVFREQDGKHIISNMNRSFEHIDMRVARVTASQELIMGEKMIPFTSFAARGAWIRMNVKDINIWNLLLRRDLLDETT